ncbi:MAG TPA: hypothetical protein VGK63_07400 [Candidatus Limnocylindrales bacterium]
MTAIVRGRVPGGPPTGRLPRLAAGGLGAVVVASLGVLLVSLAMSIATRGVAEIVYFALFLLIPASLGLVGLVLALRRPENAVGWLLLVSGCLAGVAFAAGEYVSLAATTGHLDWPLVSPAAWISNVWFVPSIGLLVVFLPLLFPTGRLLSPRWRAVAWIGVLGVVAGALGPATTATVSAEQTVLPNPLAASEPLRDAFQLATDASNVVAPVIFLVAIASLLLRFRRSRGVERQQIKWFLFTAAIGAGSFALALTNVPAVSDAAWFVGLFSLVLLPIAIGVAILRYRLYDIDRIVSRAVAYTLLTAVLAATFAVVVLTAQTLADPMIHSNAAGIAASTLIVASLFQPLRRRVQRATDRRFNRTRYDAEHEIDAFAAHVRDLVDVEPVAEALDQALHRTVQPATAAVWLRRSAT